MLSWIKGSKSEYLLADDKAARELMAELPPLDPYKALEELCYWLETLGSADDVKLARALEIIELIEQTANKQHRKLSQDYLGSIARLQKSQEIRIWNSVFLYWKRLADAYQMCLARFEAGSNGSGAIKAQIPVVVARALRALAVQLKWELLRYGPIEQRIWEQIGKLTAYAEEKAFASTPIMVYPGKAGESTIQRECLKGLMLAISSPDSLLPAKVEIAERVIAQFAEFFVMNRQPAPGCHFFFDYSGTSKPARLVSRMPMTSGLRYFGPSIAAQKLEELTQSVQLDGMFPSDTNLGDGVAVEVALDVLRHLARYWAPTPPVRAEKRRNTVWRIDVVHEFDEIVTTVSGESKDLSFDAKAEVWTIENESEGGYGALLPQAKGDWLRLGSLLGVRLEGHAAWSIGIVRRLSAYDHKQRYVGIQLLTKGATVVKLAAAKAADSAELESALLLPSNAQETNGAAEMNLLLKAGVYSAQKSMQMHAYGRRYLLMPRKLLEEGYDYDMARFQVMQSAA